MAPRASRLDPVLQGEPGVKVDLRPYQQAQVNAVLDRFNRGFQKVCLVSPTGAGKTRVAMWLTDFAVRNGRRVMFVCNRRLLVDQASRAAEALGVAHGVVMASYDMKDICAPSQIASLQTLESRHFYDKEGNATGRGLPPAELLILDECHSDLPRLAQLVKFYPHSKILGLTATPTGPDGSALVPKYFDYLLEVEHAKNSVLIQREFLLPTIVYAPSEPDIEGVTISGGQEYNQKQLGRRVRECTLFADILGEWEKHASGRSTVIFVPGIPYGRDLVDQLDFTLGKGAFKLIEAKTPQEDRDAMFAAVEAGDMLGLVSCDILREGFDLPKISCAIDVQPVNQLRTYWQKVGRIKRPYEGQTNAVLIDIAGNYWKFPHPDEDPEWPIGDDTAAQIIERRREEGAERQPIACPGCGFVRDSGARCPSCGLECGGPVRRIRMGNGELREVPLNEKKKRERSAEEIAFANWRSVLFSALHTRLTYAQCAAIYHRKYGEWPRFGWPGCYRKTDVSRQRRVSADHNTRSLSEICRWAIERIRNNG
jgi:DNA repair protein RadD